VTITLTGQAIAAGELQNTATVDSAESEAVMGNNSSSTTPIVTLPSSHNIPTASEWGLMILAGLLAMAGVVLIKR
jgi:hypothetical protein